MSVRFAISFMEKKTSMNLRVNTFNSTQRLHAEKITTLLMFAHSRLTGKSVANENDGAENVFSKDVSEPLQLKVNKLISTLEQHNNTTDYLNTLKDGVQASMLTYYYNECLKVMNTKLQKGSKVIDALIGFSIISFLIEYNWKVSQSSGHTSSSLDIILKEIDFDFTEVISMFEKSSSCDDGLVNQMQRIASEVIDKVRKANYIAFMKQKRKQSKRKR